MWSRRTLFAHLKSSGEVPSSPGAFPLGNLSMTLLSSTAIYNASSSSMADRRATVFSASSAILLSLKYSSKYCYTHLSICFSVSLIISLARDFSGAVLHLIRPKTFWIPSYIPQISIVLNDNCILSHSLSQRLVVFCVLFLAVLKTCNVRLVLYSNSATRFFSIATFSSFVLASNQSNVLLPFRHKSVQCNAGDGAPESIPSLLDNSYKWIC